MLSCEWVSAGLGRTLEFVEQQLLRLSASGVLLVPITGCRCLDQFCIVSTFWRRAPSWRTVWIRLRRCTTSSTGVTLLDLSFLGEFQQCSVNPAVLGEFRVEGRRERVALPDEDRPAVDPSQHLDIRSRTL